MEYPSAGFCLLLGQQLLFYLLMPSNVIGGDIQNSSLFTQDQREQLRTQHEWSSERSRLDRAERGETPQFMQESEDVVLRRADGTDTVPFAIIDHHISLQPSKPSRGSHGFWGKSKKPKKEEDVVYRPIPILPTAQALRNARISSAMSAEVAKKMGLQGDRMKTGIHLLRDIDDYTRRRNPVSRTQSSRSQMTSSAEGHEEDDVFDPRPDWARAEEASPQLIRNARAIRGFIEAVNDNSFDLLQATARKLRPKEDRRSTPSTDSSSLLSSKAAGGNDNAAMRRISGIYSTLRGTLRRGSKKSWRSSVSKGSEELEGDSTTVEATHGASATERPTINKSPSLRTSTGQEVDAFKRDKAALPPGILHATSLSGKSNTFKKPSMPCPSKKGEPKQKHFPVVVVPANVGVSMAHKASIDSLRAALRMGITTAPVMPAALLDWDGLRDLVRRPLEPSVSRPMDVYRPQLPPKQGRGPYEATFPRDGIRRGTLPTHSAGHDERGADVLLSTQNGRSSPFPKRPV